MKQKRIKPQMLNPQNIENKGVKMEKKFNLFLADSSVYLKFLREFQSEGEFREYIKNFDFFVESLGSALEDVRRYFNIEKKQVKTSRKFLALSKGWEEVDSRRRLLIDSGVLFTQELEGLECAVTQADSFSIPSQHLRERLKECRIGFYSWQ